MKTTLILAAALAAISLPALADPIFIPFKPDPKNASSCATTGRWKIEILPGKITMWTRTEIVQENTIPVAADGSFDKTIEMLSSNTISFQLHVWGNVNRREFNARNERRFCQYSGAW